MKIGDTVCVKKCKTFAYVEGYKISGFRGRIFDMYTDQGTEFVEIEYDSISLRSMSDEHIRAYIDDQTDYACCDFDTDEVEMSEPRDTIADVKAARKEISERIGFISIMDEEGYDVWNDTYHRAGGLLKAGDIEIPFLVSRARLRFCNIEMPKAIRRNKIRNALNRKHKKK